MSRFEKVTTLTVDSQSQCIHEGDAISSTGKGNLAGLLSAVGLGGLQFLLIMWLQGIWLPLHGYTFEQTPLWAGIYMLPLTVGFVVAGPLSGWLSDRFGARPFATGGMLLAALSFALLLFATLRPDGDDPLESASGA